jgi:hypothetical protein
MSPAARWLGQTQRPSIPCSGYLLASAPLKPKSKCSSGRGHAVGGALGAAATPGKPDRAALSRSPIHTSMLRKQLVGVAPELIGAQFERI